MRRLGLLTVVAAIGVAALVVGVGVRASTALFGDQETTTASEATAACFTNDAAAPLIASSIISKTTPYLGGSIRQGSAYYVYANITGPATRVTADIRPLTGGQFLAPLTAGAYSVGGVAYGWRTASFTAAAPLGEGAYTYSVSAANAALQCRTTSFAVAMDNTGPTGTDVQPIQGGGQNGRPATGDFITFTWSESIDPESVQAGWTGASTSVVVRITNTGTNDTLTVWNAANTVQLPLGSTALGGNYVTADSTWGASGTASTMVRSGAAITVTFGTEAGATQRINPDATAVWTPSAAVTDAAGNGTSVTVVNEGGAADRNF